MAIELCISYQNKKVTYQVQAIDQEIYTLRLNSKNILPEYVPEKLIIRRKGKLWVSDMEDHQELVRMLVEEIQAFKTNNTV